MIFLENIDKRNKCGIVKRAFAQTENARKIKGDDTVLCMSEMLIANCLDFIYAVFIACLFDNGCKFHQIIFCVITDGCPCPGFFFQHFLNVFNQFFRHKNLLCLVLPFSGVILRIMNILPDPIFLFLIKSD